MSVKVQHDGVESAQPLAGPRWEAMSLQALRAFASISRCVPSQKKVGRTWVCLSKQELVSAFRRLHALQGVEPVDV